MSLTSSLPPAPPGLLGNQRPRVDHRPPCVDDSRGWEAVDLAAVAGLHLDEWEQTALVAAAGRRQNGKWSAFEVGLVAARQNGKGSILEARELAGLFLWGERLIIHSAHEFKTGQEAFTRIRTLIEGTPVLDREVARIRTSDGEEGIELRNGNRLRFLSRTGGSGRGFTGDVVILDEAYNLPTKMIAAMLPTMAARSVAGNPQIWYTSSAGLLSSEALASIRERGLAGESDRLCYLEWSTPSWDDMTPVERARWGGDRERWRSDPDVWADANPGFGIRISEDFIRSELESPMTDAEFERERLGVWERIGGSSLIPAETWGALADEDSMPGDRIALAVDVPPDRSSAVIAAAAWRPDGLMHLELIERRDGLRWVPARLAQLVARWKPVGGGVVLLAGSAAGALNDDIRRAQVSTLLIRMVDYAAACARFYDGVTEGRFRHLGDPVLGDAVDAAKPAPKGDSAWTWARKATTDDISPLVAVTLAAWALDRRTRGGARESGSSGRKVVVM